MAKDGTWGNHVVLVAAANKYEIPIRVVSSATDRQDIIVEPSSPFNQDIEPLVLGHVFEYHYVSLEQEFTSGKTYHTAIIVQTYHVKTDWLRAFNQFTITCEVDMITFKVRGLPSFQAPRPCSVLANSERIR